MSDRLEALEERVHRLEEELAALRALVSGALPASEASEAVSVLNRIPMVRRAREKQAVANAALAQVMAEMGIKGEPVGAEKLQERIRTSGTWDATDNQAARGIIEAREE
jgi:hypothetical protein